MKPRSKDVVSTASGLHPEQRVVDHLRLAGMDQRRSLLVLRHAQTEDMRPGRRDVERRLTANGERQAAEAGEYLRKRGIKRSTPEAVGAVDGRFPAAALAELEFDGKWSRLDACSLLFVWLPAT
jgi:hypothetical protein